MELQLRTDRTCGECGVCCKALAIDDAALTKLPTVVCKNYAGPQAGCSIYGTRPTTCRKFHCGWWYLPLGDEWRPDRCRILVIWQAGNPATGAEPGFRFHFYDGHDAITWRPFVMCAANLAARGMPVYVSAAAPVGYDPCFVSLTKARGFMKAIESHDFNGTVNIISGAIQHCIRNAKKGVDFVNPRTDVTD